MYVSTKCGTVVCLIIQQRLKSMFLTIFLHSFSGPYGSAYLFLNDDFSLLPTKLSKSSPGVIRCDGYY